MVQTWWELLLASLKSGCVVFKPDVILLSYFIIIWYFEKVRSLSILSVSSKSFLYFVVNSNVSGTRQIVKLSGGARYETERDVDCVGLDPPPPVPHLTGEDGGPSKLVVFLWRLPLLPRFDNDSAALGEFEITELPALLVRCSFQP